MSQFASTLYPQTNPTNPILLAYRRRLLDSSLTSEADRWVSAIDVLMESGGWSIWDHPKNVFYSLTTCTRAQAQHARRVLTRLAALTG